MDTNVQNFNYNGKGNAIQIFNSPEFGQIRTLEIESRVWFGATSVASALGYANPRKAIIDHCKSHGVTIRDVIDSMGRNQQMKFINEGNVYRLIASSQLPQAEKFERWVFDELVPTVMNTGGYIATRSDDTPEEIMARAIMVAQETIKKKEQRISMLEQQTELQSEQLKQVAPKVAYYDTAMSSTGTYTATQIGKEYGWGGETLNRKLKEIGVQYKQNGQWLLYAKYDGKGYTKSIPRTYTKSDGTTGTQMQTVWTEKGRLFIHELLK